MNKPKKPRARKQSSSSPKTPPSEERPSKSPPALTVEDVFFELFLPMLCAERHQALARFEHAVELRLGGSPRAWSLTGGTPPWIRRGPASSPAVVMTFDAELVSELVVGLDPDVEQALATGRLRIEGDPKVLKQLELTLAEAKGIVAARLKR
ncbi:MAG: SCP2 sterol-binding domain-containing protein [Deltaproteobacteria bacterium]|nr:SCP2 sterol-binding domain-containing protein [Deltaproteobacteria bacterium]